MSVVRNVMLRVPSATAKPGPSIGQALGPLGVNMAQFVKEFNDRTKNHIPEIPLPVKLTAFSDRTFSFECRTPPTSYMIKKCAGLKKGAEKAGNGAPAGYISREALFEIAKIKKQDDHLWHVPLEGMYKTVVGTAISCGIAIKD
ncbi:hypothetical protein ScalyP_jg11129 [Parmales sp. scaly parma]|nr:hypothetical protein ScalyP_jg11129 [Parmales sp. scaly parma]